MFLLLLPHMTLWSKCLLNITLWFKCLLHITLSSKCLPHMTLWSKCLLHDTMIYACHTWDYNLNAYCTWHYDLNADLFADHDCLLFKRITNQDDSKELQDDLFSLEQQEKALQTEFNSTKCTVVRFIPNKTKKAFQTTYALHGQALRITDDSKQRSPILSHIH